MFFCRIARCVDWEFFALKACHFSGLKSFPIARSLICAFVGFSLVSGCASVEDDSANDPFEEVNRTIFDFNNEIDKSVFEPVARVYVDNVPDTLRLAVHNAVNFLKTPMIFANNVLQGNLDGAGNTVSRFLVNGIIGFGGTVDVAADSGVPYVKEDFGQTLAVWGFSEGPYLMVPILGPTNIRDGVGTLVDSFLDPLSTEVDKAAVDWPRRAADGVDTRADLLDVLDDLERTSLDYYASIRSLYRQRRADEIMNSEGDDPVPVPNLSFDDEDDKKAAGQSDELIPVIGFDDEEKPKLGAQTSLKRTR